MSFGIGMVGVSVIISFRNPEFLSVISLLHIDLWKQKDIVCRIFKAGLFVKGKDRANRMLFAEYSRWVYLR